MQDASVLIRYKVNKIQLQLAASALRFLLPLSAPGKHGHQPRAPATRLGE
jgi:hypothetical protein